VNEQAGRCKLAQIPYPYVIRFYSPGKINCFVSIPCMYLYFYQLSPLPEAVLAFGAILSSRRRYHHQYIRQYLLPGRHGDLARRKQFHFIGCGYLRSNPYQQRGRIAGYTNAGGSDKRRQ
jgi:hypothetical protein